METKEYYSFLGQRLTYEQTLKIDKHMVIVKQDGVRKRFELFTLGALHGIYYFRNLDEDIELIKERYNRSSVCILTKMIEQNGFTQYWSDSWNKDGSFLTSRIDVYDSDDRQIYWGIINEDGISIEEVMKRKYRDSHKYLYIFFYNEDGTFKSAKIDSDIDYEDGAFYPENVGDPDLDFTWEGNEFYQHAEPKIPENIIV